MKSDAFRASSSQMSPSPNLLVGSVWRRFAIVFSVT